MTLLVNAAGFFASIAVAQLALAFYDKPVRKWLAKWSKKGEYAYFKTEEGGSSRMLVSYDVPCVNGERGRVWGQTGGYDDAQMKFLGDAAALKNLDYRRHKLPAGVEGGGHGGSHGYLTDDFLHAILDPKHRHCVDVVTALNTTVAGIYAHLSALKGGETLKIPVLV